MDPRSREEVSEESEFKQNHSTFDPPLPLLSISTELNENFFSKLTVFAAKSLRRLKLSPEAPPSEYVGVGGGFGASTTLVKTAHGNMCDVWALCRLKPYIRPRTTLGFNAVF